MTTKELITRLQELDPPGDKLIVVPNIWFYNRDLPGDPYLPCTQVSYENGVIIVDHPFSMDDVDLPDIPFFKAENPLESKEK